jgi:hypothetical protein
MKSMEYFLKDELDKIYKELDKFKTLQDGWGYQNNGKIISQAAIEQAKELVQTTMPYFPEVYPLLTGGVQVEYLKWDGDDEYYIEFEITENGIHVYSVVANAKEEYDIKSYAESVQECINLVEKMFKQLEVKK